MSIQLFNHKSPFPSGRLPIRVHVPRATPRFGEAAPVTDEFQKGYALFTRFLTRTPSLALLHSGKLGVELIKAGLPEDGLNSLLNLVTRLGNEDLKNGIRLMAKLSDQKGSVDSVRHIMYRLGTMPDDKFSDMLAKITSRPIGAVRPFLWFVPVWPCLRGSENAQPDSITIRKDDIVILQALVPKISVDLARKLAEKAESLMLNGVSQQELIKALTFASRFESDDMRFAMQLAKSPAIHNLSTSDMSALITGLNEFDGPSIAKVLLIMRHLPQPILENLP